MIEYTLEYNVITKLHKNNHRQQERKGMAMNSQYKYEKQYLWYNDAWQNRDGLVDPLFQWIGSHDSIVPAPPYDRPQGDPKSLPCYRAKTNAVDLPEITRYWADRGIRYTSLEQGCKHWISILPERAMTAPSGKLKVLVVLHQEDCASPWWAMDTMAKYRQYNEMAARRQDTLIVYLVAKGPDSDRIFGNILQEACCLYPVDLSQVYLDVSLVQRLETSLSRVQGFSWQDGNGSAVDPDRFVEDFEGIPVLNISDRWGTKDSLTRGLIMNQAMNRGRFDTQRLICSKGGRKMAAAIALEHEYQTIYDPGYAEYWENMGLRFDIHETEGRRWLVFAPKQQLETGQRLPLVLIMQEVYRGNEHLAVTAASYFYEYMELAAQGECVALFFALEDPDSNDLLERIAREAMREYPVDQSRVYVTGHSHDGWFARHFAYRHPDLVAALATLGNHVGYADPDAVGNAIMGVSESEIARYAQFDMPTINVNGACEGFSHYPDTEQEQIVWAENWQRRLRASRCPVPSVAEIRKARAGDDPAMRFLGVPGDRGMDCWFDGIQHYMVDVKNLEGKYHLRVASSENIPHTVTPSMIDMSWSFLRQFARDPKTGNVIDLKENRKESTK